MNREADYTTFPCPHCGLLVMVLDSEIACSIFRHGVYKASGAQVPPHAPKEMCDSLSAQGLVYGCCGPFRYDGRSVEICDYI